MDELTVDPLQGNSPLLHGEILQGRHQGKACGAGNVEVQPVVFNPAELIAQR